MHENLGRRRFGRTGTAIGGAVLTLAASASLHAQQWTLTGYAEQQFVIDTNIRLEEEDDATVFGSITGARGILAIQDPRSTATVSLEGSAAVYTSNSDLNSQNFNFASTYEYLYPRTTLSIRGEAARTSTLLTERSDAAEFSTVGTQWNFSVSPSMSYRATPLDTFDVTGTWSRRFFDSSEFIASTSYDIRASWTRQLTLRDTISVGPRFSFIRSETPIDDTLTYSIAVLVGWARAVSNRLTFNVAAGPRVSFVREPVVVGINDNEVLVGTAFDLALTYAVTERTRITVAGSQFVEPSSQGGIQDRQRAALAINHQYSDRLDILGVASIQRNGDTFTRTSTRDDDNLLIGVGFTVSYQIAQQWITSAGYEFRALREEGGDSFATSNVFLITLRYQLRPIRLQR